MPRRLNDSPQIHRLLATLLERGDSWSYGYDLGKQTGLGSGTLYPILVRLERQGWLETRWEASAHAGRPPRHLYRLTADGGGKARATLDEAASRQERMRAKPVAEAGLDAT
jgi:DNA-binding PadR family transcriptional regulator